MNFTWKALTLKLMGRGEDGKRRKPSHLFGETLRTSSVVLIVAFVAVSWVYWTYRTDNKEKAPGKQQTTQTLYVPVQRPPDTVTVTGTPTPTTTTATPTPTPET